MIALLALSASATQLEPGFEEGRYRMTLHAASRAKVPVFGWTGSVTTSEVLVELTRTEAGWVQRHRVCDVRVDGQRGQTTIPDAFVAALPDKQYPVRLLAADGGLRYVADLGLDHLGYDPAVAGRLPRKPGDPGVLDADGDGQPGVTVRVTAPVAGSSDIYVVQRGSMRLVGEVGPDGTVRGRIEVGLLEQRTLGATNFMFAGSPPIEPVPEESWFTIERVPDDAPCERR